MCSHTIMWLWHNHGSGHGLDHHTLATQYCTITHLPIFALQSFYLSSLLSLSFLSLSLSVCRPFCSFVVMFILGNAVYPQHLRAYCCAHWEQGAQILVCLSSHNNTLDVAECNSWFSWVVDGQMMLSSLLDQGKAHPQLSYCIQRRQMGWRCFINAADIDDVMSAAEYIY